MNGKLSAGSASEPKCFDGLFPSNIKTIALTAQSMPGDAPDKIDECIDLLRKAGLNVKIMPHARDNEPGSRREDIVDVNLRAADFEQAWLDPEVDLILCIRGGWGGIDLIEKLDWDKLRRRPDMRVIGFSAIFSTLIPRVSTHSFWSAWFIAFFSSVDFAGSCDGRSPRSDIEASAGVSASINSVFSC